MPWVAVTDFQLDVVRLIVLGLGAAAAWCGVFLGRKAVSGMSSKAEANAAQNMSTHTYTGDNLTVLHSSGSPDTWAAVPTLESDERIPEEG